MRLRSHAAPNPAQSLNPSRVHALTNANAHSSVHIPLARTPTPRNRAVDTLCAALCNAAQCRLKETDARGALYCARSAMRANSAHVKAMYRGAQVRIWAQYALHALAAAGVCTSSCALARAPNSYVLTRQMAAPDGSLRHI